MPDYNCENYRRQLEAWLANHPTADDMRRRIAEKLISMEPRGWRIVDWADLHATWLVSQVWMAEHFARRDIQYRQPTGEEADALRDVRDKAKELLGALKGVRVLDGASSFLDWGGEPIAVSWTRTRAEDQERVVQVFRHLSLPPLLDTLCDECNKIIENPPARAVAKIGKNGARGTFVLAFVRRLYEQIQHHGHCAAAPRERMDASDWKVLSDAGAREISDTVRHASRAMYGADVPDDISECLRESPWRGSAAKPG